MSKPEGSSDSRTPLSDHPTVPEQHVPRAEDQEASVLQDAVGGIRGSFSFGGREPETQGEDPLEAELGDDGEGDLAPGDAPDRSGLDAPRDLRGAAE